MALNSLSEGQLSTHSLKQTMRGWLGDLNKTTCVKQNTWHIVKTTVSTLRQGPKPPRAILYNHSQQVTGLTAKLETEVFKISSLKVMKF